MLYEQAEPNSGRFVKEAHVLENTVPTQARSPSNSSRRRVVEVFCNGASKTARLVVVF